MSVKIEGPTNADMQSCEQVLRSLPDWFGIEEALVQYLKDIENMPIFLASVSGKIVGFLAINKHTTVSAEIYVMGVLLFGWMIPTMMYLRLHLGVHYPSDVLAALSLGSINVVITLLIAPDLLEYLSGLRDHASYLFGYWAFVSVFLIVGFKSWLKRV